RPGRSSRLCGALYCPLRRLVLARLFLSLSGFGGAAARPLGERRLDLLHRLSLGNALDGRDLAREPVERRLVELPFRIRLLGLRVRTIEVAPDPSDPADVAGM